MAGFPMSQRLSFPALQGWKHQQGDEQSVASFRLVGGEGHYSDAHEPIYFPKCT